MESNTAQEAKHEARKVSGAAASAAENIGKELNTGVRQVGSAIKEASVAIGSNVGAAAHDTYDSLVETGHRGAAQLESKVQESPLIAIGIAFGAGLLTSALYCRKQS